MSRREKRIFHNEELFREINARIAELHDRIGPVDEPLSLMCECDDIGCTTQIEVEHATFARVREDPRRLLVAPGHERAESETVVEQAATYTVVEKREAPGR